MAYLSCFFAKSSDDKIANLQVFSIHSLVLGLLVLQLIENYSVGGGGGIDWFIESRSLNGMGLTSRWGDVSCFHQDFVRRIFHVL